LTINLALESSLAASVVMPPCVSLLPLAASSTVFFLWLTQFIRAAMLSAEAALAATSQGI
jgi:hypothetical protein